MSDFERDMVHCLNHFFDSSNLKGYAYRLKQSKYSTQYVDVLVDSLDPRYYLAIECKSLKGKKIYFTQHFHEDKNNVHQIDAIWDFICRTGRRGFLAVEFRGGKGSLNRAFLMSWPEVMKIRETNAGISVDDFSSGIELERCDGGYRLSVLYPKELHNILQNDMTE
ncbi:Holliday junction resolvase [Methanomicrobium sp. W14]|uniref:Holliday junction resolvase n=1 Tax=Methanomicrobium sp. W14 TaxID=2817839 RepID=UPI001AEAE8E0|nr:Holliday junction resolvase [Methanomicrobium sp. W14]MBP2132224.1 Holliday junction resolvase [Methanomicrobium sp. W14]